MYITFWSCCHCYSYCYCWCFWLPRLACWLAVVACLLYQRSISTCFCVSYVNRCLIKINGFSSISCLYQNQPIVMLRGVVTSVLVVDFYKRKRTDLTRNEPGHNSDKSRRVCDVTSLCMSRHSSRLYVLVLVRAETNRNISLESRKWIYI